MLLIKNDPKYNEQWPRAVVPYKRIYGVDEPKRLPPLANDGKLVAAPAGGHAVRPGRHVEPLQARELPQRRRAAGRASRRPTPASTTPAVRGARPVQHVGERRVAQLGQPGRRRRPLHATTTSTPSASW